MATLSVNAHVAYLLAVQQVTAAIEDGNVGESDPNNYDEGITTKEGETIDTSSSQIIHAKMKMAHQGEGTNVMTQALCVKDSSLLQGLTVQNTYMELCKGSKAVTVVVRTTTAYPQMLRKKTPVARAIMVAQIPELPVLSRSMRVPEENPGHQVPMLTMKQW